MNYVSHGNSLFSDLNFQTKKREDKSAAKENYTKSVIKPINGVILVILKFVNQINGCLSPFRPENSYIFGVYLYFLPDSLNSFFQIFLSDRFVSITKKQFNKYNLLK